MITIESRSVQDNDYESLELKGNGDIALGTLSIKLKTTPFLLGGAEAKLNSLETLTKACINGRSELAMDLLQQVIALRADVNY